MIKTLLTLALPLALIGCTTHDMVVEHTSAPGVPVSAFDRYHLEVTPTERATSTHWMIEKAIHDDLRAKGYRPVDHGSADVVVRYDLDVAQDHAERDTSTNAAPPPEGEAVKTMTVTIARAESNVPVWHGMSVGEVRPSRLTASLETAIERIMSGVPASAQARADLPR
ncbi:MAG: DUF4136 domain-containing protein [Polyangiaceae bacterium]